MRTLRIILLPVTIILLVVALGLALPSINVKVQEIVSGNCDVTSPVSWAKISLEWESSGSIFQTWTLQGASVVFSDNISGKVDFSIVMEIQGYDSNSLSLVTTRVKGNLKSSTGVVSGTSYQLTLNDTPSYVVSSFLGYSKPEVLNVTGVILGGSSPCTEKLMVVVEGVGTGSTSYSPPPVEIPVINITVDNTGGAELKDNVVNFTISPSCIPDLSKVYVTDQNNEPLYFWAFNDSTNGKIWFWVNYTIPTGSVTKIQIHLNGTGVSPYFNPNKVFWYFEDFDPNLQLPQNTYYIIGYDIASFLDAGYAGYAVDTNATLGNLGWDLNWIAPYFVALYYSGYYYGIGVADDASLYEIQGTSPSGVTSVGNSLGTLPSWGPGIYSIEFYRNNSASNVHTGLYFEGDPFLRGFWSSQLTLTENFIIGQRYVGTSTYDWIGMRPVAYPSPEITVPQDCSAPSGGGDYTFTLYFRP